MSTTEDDSQRYGTVYTLYQNEIKGTNEKRVSEIDARSKFDELKFRFIKDVIARCDFD